ncbi:MAG: IPT/TIG domain-containing protein, partial [Thermosynechococcaceae cyanobacterium]
TDLSVRQDLGIHNTLKKFTRTESYSIKVLRSRKKITGFSGTATIYKDNGQNNDAGLFFGPNGVLFFSRYPVNQVGQFKTSKTINPKLIDLAPLGVTSSLSGFNLVPFGFSTAGRVKWVSYGDGKWYEGILKPDGQGTYNITSVINKTASQISSGPGGFSYVPTGSPLFPQPSILVNEYGAAKVAAYRVDAQGDPIPSSRQDFLTGLSSVWGSAIDPVTGDLLIGSWSGGTVTAISGFKAPALPSITSFTPTSGSVGTQVTVTGTNFTPGSVVRLNGQLARATIQSATQLKFKVPKGSTTGKIAVLGAGVEPQKSATDFVVP